MAFIGHIKAAEKRWFLVVLVAAIIVLGIAVCNIASGSVNASKWLNTFSILLTLAGLIQLDVSGLFEKLLEVYGDEKKYPFGPPSHYCREAVVSPDDGFLEQLMNHCFFQPKTGFWLVLSGLFFQLVAVWL